MCNKNEINVENENGLMKYLNLAPLVKRRVSTGDVR
jgi:hypothetical protein